MMRKSHFPAVVISVAGSVLLGTSTLTPATLPANAKCYCERFEERRYLDRHLTTRPWMSDSQLTVKVLVVGPDAASASACKCRVDAAVDDAGDPLLPDVSMSSTDYVDISDLDREDYKNGGSGVEAEVNLNAPKRAAHSVTSLRGIVYMRVGGVERIITVDHLPARNGKNIVDPALSAAGLSVHIDNAIGRSVQLTANGTAANLRKIEIIGDKGEDLTSDSSGSGGTEQKQESYDLGVDLPSTAKLRLTVVVGQRDVAVPFDFKNLPLP